MTVRPIVIDVKSYWGVIENEKDRFNLCHIASEC